MVVEELHEDSYSPTQAWWKTLLNYASRVEYIGMMITSVFLVYGAVITIRKPVTGLSNTTAFAAPSFTVTDESKYFKEWMSLTIQTAYKTPTNTFVNFWKTWPRRFWNFYVDSFFIPAFRKEWGKYREWSFRAPRRPFKTPLVKAEIKRRKQDKKKESKDINYGSPSVPAPHNHQDCQRIRFNIGGAIYETQERTLNRFPETVLGDPAKRIKYYDAVNQEYFFDRNGASFEAILHYFQTGGKLKRTDNVHSDVLLDDMKYYGLPHATIYQYLIEEGMTTDDSVEDTFPENLFLRKLWLLFDYPESSMQARIVAIISVSAIALSITIFCIETLSSMAGRSVNMIDIKKGTAYVKQYSSLDISDPFFFSETVCSIWFILEYFMRLFTCPKKIAFIKSYLNLIDLLAILPYFFQVLAPKQHKTNPTASVSAIRVIRLVRVFRIFKLSRHSRGLKILGKTLAASMNELFLLIFFVIVGVILFSSAVYFAELGTKGTHFTSIPEGFWWALITITTVGFGDDVPITPWGKVVGALCAVAGVLTIALPVPVIVSNFNFFYNQALGEQDQGWLKISHTPNCPYRPMENIKGAPAPRHRQKTQTNANEELNTSEEEFGQLMPTFTHIRRNKYKSYPQRPQTIRQERNSEIKQTPPTNQPE